ncbi:MAG TPA: NADPH-dependent FMN reductase [Longimicrobium sp.]|jgi:chromate reductase
MEGLRGHPIRVLGICGSVRAGSYNRGLLAAAQELAPRGMEIRIHDLGALPFFHPDGHPGGIPRPVAEFVGAVAAADALLVATPEYNYGVPAVLTNALDWASQPPGASALRGKPAAIVGASTGRGGTVRAQTQLRQAFVYTEVHALLQPELHVGAAHEKFGADGRLHDPCTRERLARVLEGLASWTLLLRGASPVPAFTGRTMILAPPD